MNLQRTFHVGDKRVYLTFKHNQNMPHGQVDVMYREFNITINGEVSPMMLTIIDDDTRWIDLVLFAPGVEKYDPWEIIDTRKVQRNRVNEGLATLFNNVLVKV